MLHMREILMPDPQVHSLPICPPIAVVCSFSLQAFNLDIVERAHVGVKNKNRQQMCVCVGRKVTRLKDDVAMLVVSLHIVFVLNQAVYNSAD